MFRLTTIIHAGQKLVLVESPNKVSAVQKILGHKYRVVGTGGHLLEASLHGNLHIVETGKSHICYTPISNKVKQIQYIKTLAEESDELYIATDADREGEGIAFGITQITRHPKIRRLLFQEITERAILKAMDESKPGIRLSLLAAQQARVALDMIIGILVSKFLRRAIPGVETTLSAGRVQTPALRLTSLNETKVLDTAVGLRLTSKPSRLTATAKVVLPRDHRRTLRCDSLKVPPGTSCVRDGNVESTVEMQNVRIVSVTDVPKRDCYPPAPPLTTAVMLTLAAKALALSPKETAACAQRLFEKGLITYPRTDSTVLCEDAVRVAKNAVQAFGAEPRDVPVNAKTPSTRGRKKKDDGAAAPAKVKHAQEAHEALRPTIQPRTAASPERFRDPAELSDLGIPPTDVKLYRLIYDATLAACTVDCSVRSAQVLFSATVRAFGGGYITNKPGAKSVTVSVAEAPFYFDDVVQWHDTLGWTPFSKNSPGSLPAGAVSYENAKEFRANGLSIKDLSLVESSCQYKPSGDETQTVSRLSAASIIGELDGLGIGRPSTLPTIVEVLLNRGYVVGSAMCATFLNLLVAQVIERYLPSLVGFSGTSIMETGLDSLVSAPTSVFDCFDHTYQGEPCFPVWKAKTSKAAKPYTGVTYTSFVEKVRREVRENLRHGILALDKCRDAASSVYLCEEPSQDRLTPKVITELKKRVYQPEIAKKSKAPKTHTDLWTSALELAHADGRVPISRPAPVTLSFSVKDGSNVAISIQRGQVSQTVEGTSMFSAPHICCFAALIVAEKALAAKKSDAEIVAAVAEALKETKLPPWYKPVKWSDAKYTPPNHLEAGNSALNGATDMLKGMTEGLPKSVGSRLFLASSHSLMACAPFHRV